MSKSILIGVAVVIVIAAALYYFLVLNKEAAPPPPAPVEQIEQGLGSDLSTNPGAIVPETNPFKEVDTNPLQGTNPFEGGFKNPFE